MIEIVDGWAVERLVRRGLAEPSRFEGLAICAPFIDDRQAEVLVVLSKRLSRERTSLSVVTRPERASELEKFLPNSMVVHRVPGLHAKVYLAEARVRSESEAIVTSANLTLAGLRRNAEVGVRATTTTRAGRRLYEATKNEMTRLLGNRRNRRLAV